MEPKRDTTEFEDPLENYDPKVYQDALEQALAEEPVEAIQSTPFASVPPDTPVCDAVEKLAKLHVACLLVQQDGHLVGVFSDRDVLDKVALEWDTVQNLPVSKVMTLEPVYVYATDSSGAALSVMAVSGYRHVPVLDLNRNVVGIVSPQRITEFLQRHVNAS